MYLNSSKLNTGVREVGVGEGWGAVAGATLPGPGAEGRVGDHRASELGLCFSAGLDRCLSSAARCGFSPQRPPLQTSSAPRPGPQAFRVPALAEELGLTRLHVHHRNYGH